MMVNSTQGSMQKLGGDMNLFDSFISTYRDVAPQRPITIHQYALFLFWMSAIVLRICKFTRKIYVKTDEKKIQDCDEEEAIKQDTVKIDMEQNDKKILTSPTPPLPTFLDFLNNASCLGAILFYFFLCDYEHHFPAADRVFSRDVFVFLMILLISVGSYFSSRDVPDKILNRDQTEEWKGWMQVSFVLYHYFKAAELYNAIRIFIAAYVWMTGFGNFSFFWVKKDFTPYRVTKMLFRLNFLVILVCIVTNNEYMLYYICAMHTFWFLSVYLLMVIKPSWNNNPWKLSIKFSIYLLVDILLFDVPGVGVVVFHPFKFILTYKDSLHEWMFRARLDHFATFIGMLSAYFYPNFETFLTSLENGKQGFLQYRTGVIIKACIGGVLLVILTVWFDCIYTLPKYSYNVLHPFTFFIPVLTYIYFRNVSSTLRKKYIWLLGWLGKITLETYISQLHIYMQGNAKQLIVYIPNYPLLNFTLATVIYIFCSYHLFQLTVNLSAYLLPKDNKLILRHCVIGSLWVSACYVLGFICSCL